MSRILLVDDENVDMNTLRRAAQRAGFDTGEIQSARNKEDAIDLIKKEDFKLAVVDIRLPDAPEGLEVIEALRTHRPLCRIIAVTKEGYDIDGSNPYGVSAMEKGAHDFICKTDVDFNFSTQLLKRLKLWKDVIARSNAPLCPAP